MMRLVFFVEGRPIAQGSMVPMIQWERRRWYMPTPPKLKKWRDTIKLCALLKVGAVRPMLPSGNGVELHLIFTLKRPKSVKPERRPWPWVKPDLDKLTRAVLDALSGTLYQDDAQVIAVYARKVYGEREGVEIEARAFTGISTVHVNVA